MCTLPSSPPALQMKTSYETDLGEGEDGSTRLLYGVSGVTRKAVREFTFACPTCAFKRATNGAAKPAPTPIVVRCVFELQQASARLQGWPLQLIAVHLAN